ncbi:MAG: sedoheptulose 7-phosphate cyclase [Verrucomicrobiota bacterium]
MKPTALAHFFSRTVLPSEMHSLSLPELVDSIAANPGILHLIETVGSQDVYSQSVIDEFTGSSHIPSLHSYRQIRSGLSLSLGKLLTEISSFVRIEDKGIADEWMMLADRVINHPEFDIQVRKLVADGPLASSYRKLAADFLEEDPHVVFPTSPYRISQGHVVSDEEYTAIDGVITSTVTTSIRVVDDVLNPAEPLLRNIYAPHRRCIALVDSNVDLHFDDTIKRYFKHHDIDLLYKVHRAMEVDKDISSVETILGQLKALGASRNEPILIVGGGVLADIAGFACALYHRNTPYVMLNTSVVSGIDAGPSPRTCSDGYGYKNLFGAYHAPIVSITDRTFFRTLRKGWIRHGVAEIIKMGGAKDVGLIDLLEQVGPRLVDTAFGTIDTPKGSEVDVLSKRILGAALKSYVESEYDNLYETHQCRPHAFGHTWSPGFEIASGMLHGHAISVGMGFNAYLSLRHGWISEDDLNRLLRVISLFDLSLWHDILLDTEILWQAQVKMVEKRGGNLCAPLPKGGLGKCGYLNDLSREDMEDAVRSYQRICETFPRNGVGIEPLCTDVGLEDPGTVGTSSRDLDTAGA